MKYYSVGLMFIFSDKTSIALMTWISNAIYINLWNMIIHLFVNLNRDMLKLGSVE